MSSIGEASSGKNQMASALAAGTDQVSQFQEVTFVKYRRVVLPADGFVFWVKNSILSPSAVYNTTPYNRFAFNTQETAVSAANQTQAEKQDLLLDSVTVPGSLHYATKLNQDEDSIFSSNAVTFTSQSVVNLLNQQDPNFLYLATIDNIRFAFSGRDNFYFQAGLWHYGGDAVYSQLASQIIDDKRQLSTRELIVSNSLPLWLAMNSAPSYPWDVVARPQVTLYPSFLVQSNIYPPYVAVHIVPDDTKPVQAAALLDASGSQTQLSRDTVRVTLLGMNNDSAQDFVGWVLQYALNNDFGVSNSPLLRDEKRTQVELQALAQKKTVTFEVNYYQNRVRAVARQLLEQAQATLFLPDTTP